MSPVNDERPVVDADLLAATLPGDGEIVPALGQPPGRTLKVTFDDGGLVYLGAVWRPSLL